MSSHIGIDIDHIQKELSTSAETSLVGRSNRQSRGGDGAGNGRCNELAVRVGAEQRLEVAWNPPLIHPLEGTKHTAY